MIRMIGVSERDGWALVQEFDRFVLIRPPYLKDEMAQLTIEQVRRSLVDEDFEPANDEFEGWGLLVRELQRRRVNSASPEELERARDAATEILARANADQARRHFARIRRELENGRTVGVRTALMALLGSDAVACTAELVRDCRELLAKTDQLVAMRAAGVGKPDSDWPVANEEQVKQQQSAIKSRGSVFGWSGIEAA